MIERAISDYVVASQASTAEQRRRRLPVYQLCAAAAGLALVLSGCSTARQNNEPASEAPSPVALHFDANPKISKIENPIPNPEGNRQINPRGITLHWWSFGAGGNIQALRKELKQNKACGSTGCSVQYAITEDGKKYLMMNSPTDFAYHAGTANSTTFGIEIEGGPQDFALPGEPGFNQKKFEAVVSLTAELDEDFNLPLKGRVVCGNISGTHGHHEYNGCSNPPAEKSDVGPAYTQAVIDAVKQLQ